MGNRLYSLQNIAEQSVAATYHGRPVRRLSYELQLVYIASSWVLDLTLSKIHPSFLPALFDAVYLLKSFRRDLDWNGMMDWLDNELAAASLYVMLSYLSQRRVCHTQSFPISEQASVWLALSNCQSFMACWITI